MKAPFLCGVSLVLMSAALAAPAYAQDSADGTTKGTASAAARSGQATKARPADGGDGDIVVTARRRTESLQDVPISVAVISGTRLEQLGIASTGALQSVTAGLIIRQTPFNVPNISLRGLSTGTAVDAFEQSVGLFIDGTYAGRGPEYNSSIFDVQRVEVIRGAQASLLSKNTSLGAISLTTRKPGDKFEANVIGSYELERGSAAVQGGVSIPLTSTLAVRMSGSLENNYGSLRNFPGGEKSPHVQRAAGRFIGVWKPDPSLDVTLLYQQFEADQKGSPFEVISDPTGQLASLARLAGSVDFETDLNYRTNATSADGPFRDDVKGQRAISTINYQIGGGYTLTSTTSYSKYDDHRFFDFDFTQGDYVTAISNQGNRQFQQDFRISSPVQGQLIDFVAGGSYYHENWFITQSRNARCIGCTPGQLALFPFRGAMIESDYQRTRNFAAFGQVNVHLTDRFTVTGGARYTNEKRDATLSRDTITPGGLTAVLYQAFPSITVHRKESNVDGAVGANFKATNRLLLYASASRGTKGGGFLNAPTALVTPADLAASEYGNERATTYEAGAKLSLPHSGYLNAALFQTRVDNFQQSLFVNPRIIVTQRNVRSRGVEAEGAIQLIDGVRIQGQVAYLDVRRLDTPAEYRPVGAAKWSGNANLALRHDLGSKLSTTLDVGSEFRSGIYLTDAETTIGFPGRPNNVLPYSDGYVLLNARLGLVSRDGWEMALVGRNLTDKLATEFGGQVVFAAAAGIVNTIPRRTVALQFRYNY